VSVSLAAIGLEELLQYIVLFAIFVLPGIKASREAKKKKDEHARRRKPSAPVPDAHAGPRPDQPSGKELWERLLRGEIDPAAPPPPPPVPSTPRPKKPREPKPPESKPRPQPIVRKPLSAPMGGTGGLGSLASERPPLPQAVPEYAVEEDLPALEALASPFEGPVEAVHRQVDPEAADLTPASIVIETPGSPDDWRRAIILAEVLGSPVSLREGAGSRPGCS